MEISLEGLEFRLLLLLGDIFKGIELLELTFSHEPKVVFDIARDMCAGDRNALGKASCCQTLAEARLLMGNEKYEKWVFERIEIFKEKKVIPWAAMMAIRQRPNEPQAILKTPR